MLNKELIGRKIYLLRKISGKTQEYMANHLHITPQSISKWEKGVSLPDIDILPDVAEFFNVSIKELLCLNPIDNNSSLSDTGKIMLSKLSYYPDAPSYIGCLKSALDYIGMDISLGWISAPYAFMLSTNSKVSPGCTESWYDSGFSDEFIQNVGGIGHNYFAFTSDHDIEQKLKVIRSLICDSINKELPAIVWGMDKLRYSIVSGYDNVGYYYMDVDDMKIKGPVLFDELGENDLKKVEVHIIHPGSISSTYQTLISTFEYALSIGNPKKHSNNLRHSLGMNAYETWWKAIESGQADSYGIAASAAFWANCKNLAVLFLSEAKLRVGLFGDLFNMAISSYEKTASSLSQLSQLFPIDKITDYSSNKQLSNSAIELLKAAQKNEMDGLKSISYILDELKKLSNLEGKLKVQ